MSTDSSSSNGHHHSSSSSGKHHHHHHHHDDASRFKNHTLNAAKRRKMIMRIAYFTLWAVAILVVLLCVLSYFVEI